jgi:hypothetical protein
VHARHVIESEGSIVGRERIGSTIAQPFEWKFTRQDLDEFLVKLSTPRRSPIR